MPTKSRSPRSVHDAHKEAVVDSILNNLSARLAGSTHVDDVVDAILKALDHKQHRYDAYNVVSGTAATVSELVSIVRELVPGADLSVGPGPYRHGDRFEMIRKGSLDVSRAAAEFGWKPRYDIRAGLAAYVKAIRHVQSSSS